MAVEENDDSTLLEAKIKSLRQLVGDLEEAWTQRKKEEAEAHAASMKARRERDDLIGKEPRRHG